MTERQRQLAKIRRAIKGYENQLMSLCNTPDYDEQEYQLTVLLVAARNALATMKRCR